MIEKLEYEKAQKLSQYIDQLNEGHQPIAQDEEIKSLVEVASLVKESYIEKELPRELINKMVEQLAVELEHNKKKKPIYWRYKGIMGGVAALVIAAFIHLLLPATLSPEFSQENIALIEKQERTVSPDTNQQPTSEGITTEPSSAAPDVKEVLPAPREEKPSSTASMILAEIIDEAALPPLAEIPNQVAKVQEEKTSEMKVESKVLMRNVVGNSAVKEKNSPVENPKRRMLVLPNQSPQSVIIESDSGDIKQIYQWGAHDKILITQEGERSKMIKNQETKILLRKIEDKKNRLQLQIKNYTVWLEGETTIEELKKIGESLIEKELIE